MNRRLPTVTFVICNYNGREYLEPLLESLQALDYPKKLLEIIVVDNASSDGSLEYLKGYGSEIKLIRNEQNLGFARASNQGAGAAGGEWLAFINNDMRLEPDWLRQLFTALNNLGDEVACAGGKILSWDGKRIDFVGGTLAFYGHAFQKQFGEKVSADGKSLPEETLFACGGSMLIRRKTFLEVGRFDDDYFAYFEDVDLGWRLWLMGHKVVLVPGAIAYHHHFGTTRKFAENRHLFLCERNALSSVYKNYSDENLKQILPASLLLMINRFFLHTNLGPDVFQKELLVSAVAEKRLQKDEEAGLSKFFQLLGDIGVRGTMDRAALSLAIAELKKNGMSPVSEKGIAILASAPVFVSQLSNLAEKRKFVQARRRRQDKEIFHLFKEPLHHFPDTPAYKIGFEQIVASFGIQEIFRQ